jgi:hypothetical protein
MGFAISGLDPAPFRPLFGLSDDELRLRGAIRYVADEPDAFPDRVELRDARPGEAVLLVNHLHQGADTPYRSSHAVFIREGASEPRTLIDRLPRSLEIRLLSLRAFDAGHMMVDADVVEGDAAEPVIARLLDDPEVAYIQAHFARRGCYAARIERA